jgi:methenyltetrahydrofolate cyclohydrolase
MKPSVWESTLEEFRKQVGGRRPVPASGSVSAVAASLSLHLLVKVLEITAYKKGFAADPEKLKTLIEASKAESARLERYADEDVAAFNSYLESAKLPESNDAERGLRRRARESALQQVIEGPLQAARSAAGGLGLCAGTLALIPKSMIADLGAAASLLAGASRGLMVSAEFNIRQLAADRNAYSQAAAQLEELKREVREQERSISRQVAAMIGGKEA